MIPVNGRSRGLHCTWVCGKEDGVVTIETAEASTVNGGALNAYITAAKGKAAFKGGLIQ